MSKTVFQSTLSTAERGYKQTVFDIQKQGIEASFSKFDKATVENIRERSYEAVNYTLDTVESRVNENLMNSVREGYGMDKAASELRTVTDNVPDANLKVLARTEIHSAANQSSYQALLDNPYIDFQEWMTARDDRVRGEDPKDEADHVVLDGEIVRLGELFSNGLLYPGDMDGELEEIIQCRCETKGFIPPFGKTFIGDGPFHEEDLVDDPTIQNKDKRESV